LRFAIIKEAARELRDHGLLALDDNRNDCPDRTGRQPEAAAQTPSPVE
jgi:hypothetical protein